MPTRRRWLWLGAAAVLFGLAAYLMAGPDEAPKPEVHVAFPVRQTPEEHQREQRRHTLLPLLAQLASADAGHRRLRPSDPVLAALPPKGPGASAVVFEANAIRNSPVGALLLDCLRARHHQEDPLESIKRNTGIDLGKDLDRLAVTNHGVVVSGSFEHANWDQIFSGMQNPSPYGDQGTIYEDSHAQPGQPPMALGRWGNQMLIVGDSSVDVQQVIDRLEDRAPDAAPLLSESDTYGEVYGAIDPADLASMLPDEASGVAEQLRNAAQQVKLHVDATNDVAMVADISGPDSQQVSDLGKALGGAMSLARLKLQADGSGSDLLADLLDEAKVTPGDGTFRTELALPLSVLQKHLGNCREPLDGGLSPPAPN